MEDFVSLRGLMDLLDWRALLYLLVAMLMLFIAKLCNQRFTGYALDRQLTEVDNKAVAVSFTGYLVALCLVFHGILVSPSGLNIYETGWLGWANDLFNTFVWCGVGMVMLLISRVVNDRLILPKFSNQKELVKDRNVGLGAAQAGSYIATALIIRASLSGDEVGVFYEEFFLSGVFFLIGQALLILFSYLYQWGTKFDMHAELEADNPAVGVAFAGNLVGFGILLAFYVRSDDSLVGLLLWGVVSAVVLILTRKLVDWMILPYAQVDKEISEDRNWGAGLIEAGVVIGVSLVLVGAFW